MEDDVKRSRGRMLTRREGRVEKNIAQESPLFFFSAQFTSYWDCLPPELRLPIKEMAMKQYWKDERDKELRQRVLDEMHHYHQVRQAWGLGPLKLYRRQGILNIWAKYWDMEDNRVRQTFLGSGKWSSAWKQAFQRVNHVKSFL